MEPSARVVLDSLHPDGRSRVTTMEVVMHRFVLAEFNTHRMFSRNSASSRAIPLYRQIARVEEGIAWPVSWPTEQKGMQGGDELGGMQQRDAEQVWHRASRDAIRHAERLGQIGVHKSVINRLLEPFLWHIVIVTATEWANFWALRCNPLAQPEMRAAAEEMRAAYEGSTPQRLDYGDWHQPLVTGIDDESLVGGFTDDDLKRISAARCARVSYLTHDGKRDPEADLALAERLANPGEGAAHASPFEHVCRPLRYDEHGCPEGRQVGNLIGWRQFRHDLEDANR